MSHTTRVAALFMHCSRSSLGKSCTAGSVSKIWLCHCSNNPTKLWFLLAQCKTNSYHFQTRADTAVCFDRPNIEPACSAVRSNLFFFFSLAGVEPGRKGFWATCKLFFFSQSVRQFPSTATLKISRPLVLFFLNNPAEKVNSRAFLRTFVL